MRIVGEAWLLIAFVGAGFAAFANLAPAAREDRRVRRAGAWAANLSVLGLTIVSTILVWALIHKDFAFSYVAQYANRQLSWHYAVSALWVGQAGSLLLWAWMLGVLTLLFRVRSRPVRRDAEGASRASESLSPVSTPGWSMGVEQDRRPNPRENGASGGASTISPTAADPRLAAGQTVGDQAFGVLMAYLCFLLAVIVFAADPMEASATRVAEGSGLSPLLQHPAMLVHPPVIFLGYALWTIPFALAAAALVSGRLEEGWICQARPWALTAWCILGIGILVGADWAYEELGWGGYWGWDPVENGSLLPWLTGTALIHALMTWQHCQTLKKSTIGLTIATFALCNFATFLTRSGVFSSLHAFSQSSIGWLFLVLMIGLAVGGIVGVVWRREMLAPGRSLRSALSREALVLLGVLALLLLAVTVLIGTISSALSVLITGRAVLVGPAFYNSVLAPVGLLLILIAAATPLLRWGRGPDRAQTAWLIGSTCIGLAISAAAAWMGVRQPAALAVAALVGLAVTAFIGAVLLDGKRRAPSRPAWGAWLALRGGRRQYAGFVIHLGLVLLAVGVAGSSLGKHEQDFQLAEGQVVEWAGHRIRVAEARQRELPDRVAAEAVLEFSRPGRRSMTLVPAQHYHTLQRQWTTEVAIGSTWSGDLYTILHGRAPDGRLSLTFVENPLMRWLWLGGAVMVLGTCLRLWPARRRSSRRRTAERAARTSQSQPVHPRGAVPPPIARPGRATSARPALSRRT